LILRHKKHSVCTYSGMQEKGYKTTHDNGVG
jgi:hypothetical protein